MFAKGNKWSAIGRKARKARGSRATKRHFVASVELAPGDRQNYNIWIWKGGVEVMRRYGKRRFRLDFGKAMSVLVRAAHRSWMEERIAMKGRLRRQRSVS